MLDDTAPEGALDAIQLAALRKCDDVSFHHRDGKSYMRAVKRVRQSEREPFAQDVIVEITCDTRWDDYAREFATSYPMPSFNAFEMVGNYTDSCWRTIASMLRKGDRLMLHWSRNCFGKDSDLAVAGFQMDRLTLCVARGSDQRLHFHIDDSVVRPGNSARMIRDVRPAAEYKLTEGN
jgi:hypothetical protein